MIKLGNNIYHSDEVISCVNFLKNSDVVFAGTLSENDFNDFQFENPKIISRSNGLVTFVNLAFDLNENNSIYCQLDFLEVLFRLINHLDFKNIKIISTQSDRKITKNIFNQKPNCVSKWYSINVDYKNECLVSIPLGIASYRNTKSVIFDDFVDLQQQNKIKNSFYTNFNINTNYFHRIKAQKSISTHLEQNVLENIDYISYLRNLSSSIYSIAPWGNGYDTHRFWESLYCGTIPITKKNIHYDTFNDLPVILLNNYDEIKDVGDNHNFYNKKLKKLNINWWLDQLKSEVDSDLHEVHINFDKTDLNFLKRHLLKIKYKDKLKKNFYTFLRKIHKKINNFRRI